MLEKERFLAIKKLAKDIRKENKEILKKIEKMPSEKAIEEKNKFIDSVMENMTDAFSGGEQGKEEKQIFRANILIPDDEEFYDTYSNNKNIRNLMSKYSVNIEDIMSKITELNIYGKYMEEDSNETNFVDEMVKISPKQAEDLLDEIDNLSNTLTNLDLSEIKNYQSKRQAEEKKISITDEDVKKEIEKNKTTSFINNSLKNTMDEPLEKEDIDLASDNVLDESFDSINRAITGFVTDYNNLKNKNRDKEEKINDLEEKIRKLDEENKRIKEENSNLHSRQSEYRQDNSELKTENSKLNSNIKKLNMENEKINSRMKLLEDKLIKTAALLNKVYNGIHKD